MKANLTHLVHLFRLFILTTTGLITACGNSASTQQVAETQPAPIPVQEAPVQESANEQSDKSVFTGRYSGVDDESGENHILIVQVENGKLMLGYRSGGTMEYAYGEKSIEEIKIGVEYLLNTEDLDGNGVISFLFRLNAEGKANEVVATWVGDKEIKPVVMKAD